MKALLCAATFAVLVSTPGLGADAVSLVGTWTGQRDRIAKIEGRRGMQRLGATENGPTSTKITGLHIGIMANGIEIPFRARARKIEYYNILGMININ